VEENKEIKRVKTLETEVKEFASSLPYWAKFICSKILSNEKVFNSDIDTAYNYVADELKLIEKVEKPEIELNYNPNNSGDYKEELVIDTLKNIQGVNALAENQEIEFSPNVTVIYGANGSGKSGYIRLLKKAFYSKHKEEILKNIYKGGNKDINAEFNFKSKDTDIPLTYPSNATNGIFNQFAVFDGKIALKHLEERNNFEFRPAGLTLFSEFNSALEKLQNKINEEIRKKPVANPYADIFEGESEINTFINSLSSKSKLDDLKKNTPFSEQDKTDKKKIENDYDDIKIALSTKYKQVKALQSIKTQIEKVEKNLKVINTYFKQEYINSISTSIQDCLTKEETAQKEGVENFKTDKITNVGSKEWKEFIQSAEKFALIQKETSNYPEIDDYCILCQQPISQEQKDLISSYWTFLKSVAEKEAKDAQIAIDKIKIGFQKIPFTQVPDENTLTVWLKENYEDKLTTFKLELESQKVLSEQIISDLETKKVNSYTEIQVNTLPITDIISAIDEKIKQFLEDDQNKALAELLKKKTYLVHKEKLEHQFSNIENLHQNMVWVNKANKFDKQYWKRNSTSTEKRLSQKYFNEQYIKTFNQECNYLNGSFGIDIDARSSDGKSNRQLFLKGKTPSAILSEGEQKVIAIADFMTETNLSPINKGIFFDDPVNSLDEDRKNNIAERLIVDAKNRQVAIFTHDLVFLSNILNHCEDYSINYRCHWIEKLDDEVGKIWKDNTPSYEKKYKKSGVAQGYYQKSKKAPPEEREALVKTGFAALRSSYEAFVIFDLFAGVVQRFNDRVSIDSLNSVYVDDDIVKEIMASFGLACRYMEGHSHSDKFLSKKPTPEQLNEEIQRFDSLKKKLKELKK
jgi:hypothetical protein